MSKTQTSFNGPSQTSTHSFLSSPSVPLEIAHESERSLIPKFPFELQCFSSTTAPRAGHTNAEMEANLFTLSQKSTSFKGKAGLNAQYEGGCFCGQTAEGSHGSAKIADGAVAENCRVKDNWRLSSKNFPHYSWSRWRQLRHGFDPIMWHQSQLHAPSCQSFLLVCIFINLR